MRCQLGFNVLSLDEWDDIVKELKAKDIEDGMMGFDDYIWKDYNEIWLEDAMKRGDDIVIWSDPLSESNLEKLFTKDGVFDKSFFGRELDFIKNNASKYGYDYSGGVSVGVFKK